MDVRHIKQLLQIASLKKASVLPFLITSITFNTNIDWSAGTTIA